MIFASIEITEELNKHSGKFGEWQCAYRGYKTEENNF